MRYGYRFGYGSILGLRLSVGGTITITSSDGDPASLTDNGDGTFDVIINAVNVGTITQAQINVGTITQAQINVGGWITVVEPVAGMSGNNVVLTTTGHVIYVGDVAIESDVEVFADSALVGSALPFDATAYPDATLTVRWSFTTGTDDLVIDSTARNAPLKLIQFRDSYIDLASNDLRPWPSAQRSRRMTMAMRVTAGFNQSAFDPVTNPRARVITHAGVGFGTNTTSSNSGEVRSISPAPFQQFAAAGFLQGMNQQVSILAAVDYDGGLPGGEKFVVWMSRNGGAWARFTGSAAGPGDARNVWLPSIGAENAGVASGHFDLHNHLWTANVALDPATNWQNFFNTDGTVKQLPADGVIEGVTPVIFMVGNDFVTGANRGSGGGTAVASRTPITVVNA